MDRFNCGSSRRGNKFLRVPFFRLENRALPGRDAGPVRGEWPGRAGRAGGGKPRFAWLCIIRNFILYRETVRKIAGSRNVDAL